MDPEALKAASRPIHGHLRESPAATLTRVADWCRDREVGFDAYGQGALIQEFEAEVAELLGCAAARFMPSGTLAQQLAMRIWADRAGVNHVAMHPTAHLELHEQRGYSHLHGLEATLVGPRGRAMVAADLAALPQLVAALLIELPTREAGGVLPSWAELNAIKDEARRRGMRLHLDGARLWECGPAYGKSYREICEGFDSTYVSFYKGIGALPGAMLLGSEDFIAEAAVWQRRAGGNLFTLTPNVASAAMQLQHRLSRMPILLERARQMAQVLAAVDCITVKPDPPDVNMFHLYLNLDVEAALGARNRVAEELQLWAYGWVAPSEVPSISRTEIHVGEAAMQVSDTDLDRAFRSLMSGG